MDGKEDNNSKITIELEGLKFLSESKANRF